MSAEQDYYSLLNVREDASTDEIKTAYRKLAKRYHPDRVSGAEKEKAEMRFKEISAAYYVLGDEKRRREYDEYRRHQRSYTAGGYGPQDFASQKGFDFEELLKHFQGAGFSAGRQRPRRRDRYFFFDDLSDIFGGFAGMHDPADGGYTVYHSHASPGPQKVQTDMYAEVAISPDIARQGGTLKLELSDRRTISLTIKPVTKNGQKLRLKGLGNICPTCSHAGDLIITVKYK